MKNIIKLVFSLIVVISIIVFAADQNQLANEIKNLELLWGQNNVSREVARQTVERIEKELPQYPDSAEKANAYLLAAEIENMWGAWTDTGQRDVNTAIRLLTESLKIKQIDPLDKIDSTFWYAVCLMEKNENQTAIEKFREARQLSVQCLDEECYKKPTIHFVKPAKTQFGSIFADWSGASELESEMLVKENKPKAAIAALEDFASRIIPYVMKQDQQERKNIGFWVSNAWIKYAKIFKDSDQNVNSEPFTKAIASLPDTLDVNNNPEFGDVRLVLEFCRAVVSSDDSQKCIDNAMKVIENNVDNPALNKVITHFTTSYYQKSLPEIYVYMQKLLMLNKTHPAYKPSASIYEFAGNIAYDLKRYDEAKLIYEELLQKFPEDKGRNEVERKLQNLKQMEEYP